MMYNGGTGMGWIAMLFGGLIFLGVTILVIFLIVRLVQSGSRPDSGRLAGSGPESVNRALDILAERYARGEINDEEYIRMKNELRK